jgi:orotidine-5'-phosphate decarboxylase
MGSDSVEPFLAFADKFTILLALTSNKGGLDFQILKDENGLTLYEKVLKNSQKWKNSDRLMYVVGATRPEYFRKIRNLVPNNFLLVPGIGAQGGELQEVCKYGMNDQIGLLVNSSRGIIYASTEKDFAIKAQIKAKELQQEMELIINSVLK